MSYQKAIEALKENLSIVDAKADPVTHNLCVALLYLAQANDARTAEIIARLEQLDRDLRNQ